MTQDVWVFEAGDAAAFIDWIHANEAGYFVNLRTDGIVAGGRPSPMMHRADCGHFKGEDHLSWTDNVKVCSGTQFMLRRWLREEFDSEDTLPCDCLR
jgi:hypothetical protein